MYLYKKYKTGTTGQTLMHRKFDQNVRKNFFVTVGVTMHWNRLPREV